MNLNEERIGINPFGRRHGWSSSLSGGILISRAAPR